MILGSTRKKWGPFWGLDHFGGCTELLTVDNPQIQQLIDHYHQLRGIKIQDLDSKEQLPVHVVLGSGEYA